MSQDLVADGLNQIMNAKKAKIKNVVLKRHSKLLRKVLDILKSADYIDYSLDGSLLKIDIKKLNELKALKPRYTASINQIELYVRRFLPAKNFGFIIISTNKGLMSHIEAQEKNLGGCLIAYVY